MPNVREDRDRFAGLVRDTARNLGLFEVLVEKDYWAVEALRAVRGGFDVQVGSDLEHVSPIFKGGTSLSKAYGLVERFSEDVDLLIAVEGYTQRQRADVLKACTAAVSAVLGIEGAQTMVRRGVDRHWLYPYDPVATADMALAGIEPAIKVEVTVMGGPNPHAPATITSFVADHAGTIDGFPAYDDLQPFAVDTLAAERTLVEKLAMLHDAAHQALDGHPARLAGAGRHFYDIAQLLSSPAVIEVLSPEWVAEIAADADRWSDAGNFPFTPRPDDGFGSSPAFTDPNLLEVVRPGYEVAISWVWSPTKPTLDECVAVVAQHAHLV